MTLSLKKSLSKIILPGNLIQNEVENVTRDPLKVENLSFINGKYARSFCFDLSLNRLTTISHGYNKDYDFYLQNEKFRHVKTTFQQ